jgi:hypothetical protein
MVALLRATMGAAGRAAIPSRLGVLRPVATEPKPTPDFNHLVIAGLAQPPRRAGRGGLEEPSHAGKQTLRVMDLGLRDTRDERAGSQQ